MRDWLLELRDSDGNDCTVYDVLVTAETSEKALEIACDRAEAEFGGESDGSFGAYYECEHDCPECEGGGCEGGCPEMDCDAAHGGWSISETNVAEVTDIKAQCSIYHRMLDWREDA